MVLIMIIYYIISIFIAVMIIWNLISERENKQKIILYMIVLIPFILRIFRIR